MASFASLLDATFDKVSVVVSKMHPPTFKCTNCIPCFSNRLVSGFVDASSEKSENSEDPDLKDSVDDA